MSFINEDPHQLAPKLVGKQLVVNGVLATIEEVKVRDEAHCAGFKRRAILRTENPPDAAAEPYAHTVPFFIRTRGQTCIQIEKVKVRDRFYSGAGKVGCILRLYEKGTASLIKRGKLLIAIWDE